jgi:transcriptional regulator with XRE-family HTH domain
VSSTINATVAHQCRLLRKKYGWDQTELGEKAGMKQTAISRVENTDYGNFTINTLKRIAGALDVGLVVRFASFGELVDWNLSLSEQALSPPSFEEERETIAQAHTQWDANVQAANFSYLSVPEASPDYVLNYGTGPAVIQMKTGQPQAVPGENQPWLYIDAGTALNLDWPQPAKLPPEHYQIYEAAVGPELKEQNAE